MNLFVYQSVFSLYVFCSLSAIGFSHRIHAEITTSQSLLANSNEFCQYSDSNMDGKMTFETKFRFPVCHDVSGNVEVEYFWSKSRDDAFVDAVGFCQTPFKRHRKSLQSTSIDVTDWDLAQVGPVAYLTREEFLCQSPDQIKTMAGLRSDRAKAALDRYRSKRCKWSKIAFKWENSAKRALMNRAENHGGEKHV